jgi:hypothetical protein
VSGLRAAVDAMCKACIYDDQAPGTWRSQVEACAITACPLHEHRPKMTSKVRNMPNLAQSQTELAGAA